MESRVHRWRRRVLAFALIWSINLGLWVLFTAKLAGDELVAGAIAAVPGAVGFLIVRRAVPITLQPRPGDLLQCWRIPWYVLTGTVEIMHGLMLQLFSRQRAPSLVRSVAYESESEDSAQTRTVLAVTYTTMTPNFVVIGVVPERRQMIYHQILPGEVLQITINLGARP